MTSRHTLQPLAGLCQPNRASGNKLALLGFWALATARCPQGAKISDGTTATQRYYVWGAIRSTSGTLPTDYAFTGQRLDNSTGLLHYGARWYDPALARFVSADSIVPQPGNPQSLSRYSYVLNSPASYMDPSGHVVDPLGAGHLVRSKIPESSLPDPDEVRALARVLYGEQNYAPDEHVLAVGWILHNRVVTKWHASYQEAADSMQWAAILESGKDPWGRPTATELESAGDEEWERMMRWALEMLVKYFNDPTTNPMIANPNAVYCTNTRNDHDRKGYEALLNFYPDPSDPWIGPGYWGKLTFGEVNLFYFGPRPGKTPDNFPVKMIPEAYERGWVR